MGQTGAEIESRPIIERGERPLNESLAQAFFAVAPASDRGSLSSDDQRTHARGHGSALVHWRPPRKAGQQEARYAVRLSRNPQLERKGPAGTFSPDVDGSRRHS